MLTNKATMQVIKPSSTHRIFGQYIVKPGLQFKCGLIALGLVGLSLFWVCLESNWVVGRLIDTNVITNEEIISELRLMTGMMWKTGVMMGALSFVLGIFLSHMVAGPLYRFEKIFQEMAEGNLTSIVRIRSHDQLTETADRLNQGLIGLRNKVRKDRETIEPILAQAKAIAEGLNKIGPGPEADKIKQLIDSIRNLNYQIKLP
jgi:methyl-accepting chemotaxis protein